MTYTEHRCAVGLDGAIMPVRAGSTGSEDDGAGTDGSSGGSHYEIPDVFMVEKMLLAANDCIKNQCM